MSRELDVVTLTGNEYDTLLNEAAAAEQLRAAVHDAIKRLEEIDSRDGGPAWRKAKDILGCDLYLVLHGLQQATNSIA